MYQGECSTSGACTLQTGSDSLIGYTVYDFADTRIGKVESVWEDDDGKPEFLCVRTGWLGLGKLRMIPARAVRYSERDYAIRVPFSKQIVVDSPDYSDREDFDSRTGDELHSYYRGHGWMWEGGASGATAQAQPMQGETEQDRTLRLEEERLKVGKRQVETGGVRLRKVVRSETVQVPVQLKREDVQIERVPAGSSTATGNFSEEELFVPLYREEPVVEKSAAVREEVRVRKTEEIEEQDVSDTVRREELEVDKDEPSYVGRRDPT
jgi:uncharacterized protein (TIGR02271 family)